MSVDMPAAAAASANERLSVFVDRIWIGLLVVICFTVPISLARTFIVGWQPAYATQFLMLLVLGSGFILRHLIGMRLRALTLIVLLDFNGIVSVVSFGLFGVSWWWLVMSSLLVAFVFRTRAGMLHAAAAFVLLAIVGLAFVQGWLTMDFDANVYGRQLLAWAGMLTGPVLFSVFVFWACDAFLKVEVPAVPHDS